VARTAMASQFPNRVLLFIFLSLLAYRRRILP